MRLKVNALSSPCEARLTVSVVVRPSMAVTFPTLNVRVPEASNGLSFCTTGDFESARACATAEVGPPTAVSGSNPTAYRPACTQSVTSICRATTSREVSSALSSVIISSKSVKVCQAEANHAPKRSARLQAEEQIEPTGALTRRGPG